MSRKCPSCKHNIEKNGGCNHMCCRNCHYHFCWQCMGKFGSGPMGDNSGYSNHKCNTYVEGDSKVILDKEDWERFRWYSERYNNHHRSQDIEKKLREDATDVRHMLQHNHALNWTGSQYYTDAIDQLITARNIMKGSYIFGFFRPTHCPEIHKELFEHRQNELERHTEQLSNLLQGDNVETTKLSNIFQQKSVFLNTTKLVNTSYKALLDVAANAIVEKKNYSLWKYNQTGQKTQDSSEKKKKIKKKKKNFALILSLIHN
eukprot:TRINITY_DN15897_c0_g1_i1.p1 TRINITY_DN15897_c0_g1~~TRINITY_DN15897_c0_g1_i1.p1  ORF type:complete len:268 (-),score=46.86 TRINITY_DN15897_c0_g1_i1:62-841(-)